MLMVGAVKPLVCGLVMTKSITMGGVVIIDGHAVSG